MEVKQQDALFKHQGNSANFVLISRVTDAVVAVAISH